MKKISGENSISKKLTGRQKEVLKLLQRKEVIIVNKKKVFVTKGNDTKKITPHSFYNLVNRGLIFHENKSPNNYVLSTTGKIIRV